MKKWLFDGLFIMFSAVVMLALNEFNLLERYIGYAMIPVLIAYLLGQYSEKKFGGK